MAEDPKSLNVVKKVFDREKGGRGILSPLFTHRKENPKVLSSTVGSRSSHLMPPVLMMASTLCRFVEVARDEQDRFSITTLDEEIFSDSTEAVDPERQSKALQALLSRNARRQRPVFVLSIKDLQFYSFSFPKLETKELEDALKFKIRQAKPFELDIEDVRFGYVSWGTTDHTEALKVLAYATPRKALEDRLKQLKTLGVVPSAVVPGPLMLSAASSKAKKEGLIEEVVVWIDFSSDESFFVVEKAGEVCFARRLTVTGKQLVGQIAQYCKVEWEEAITLKDRYGLSAIALSQDRKSASQKMEEDQEDFLKAQTVYQAMVSTLENFVIDLEHSFKHFSYQISQSQITEFHRIKLSGSEAVLRGMDAFLTQRLGVPVDVLDPVVDWKLETSPVNRKTQRVIQGSDWALALSIAAFPGYVSKFNLLPQSVRRFSQSPVEYLKSRAKWVGALLFVLLISSLAPPIWQVNRLKTKSGLLAKQVLKIKKQLTLAQADQLHMAEEETAGLSRKAALESRLGLYARGDGSKKIFSETLAKLAELMPEEIRVTDFLYAKGTLKIIAVSVDTGFVVKLMGNLKALPEYFDQPSFNYSQKETELEGYRCEISVGVR